MGIILLLLDGRGLNDDGDRCVCFVVCLECLESIQIDWATRRDAVFAISCGRSKSFNTCEACLMKVFYGYETELAIIHGNIVIMNLLDVVLEPVRGNLFVLGGPNDFHIHDLLD